MQARESVGTPFQFLAAVSGPTNDALEFHRALDVVAAHARGPLGAERVRQRRPSSNHVEIEGALAPVAELLTLWGRGEAIDIPPVPELGPVISRLRVAGSVLDGWELALVKQTLAAARIAAGEIRRVAAEAPALAASVVPLPERAIDQRLVAAITDEGEVLDTAAQFGE